MKNTEKYKHGEFGFYTLGDIVDRYMAHSFNNGRKHFKNMLIIGADAWKELYWKTLRVTKNKRIKVDRTTMTVRIPHDCMKVIAVKVLDDCYRAQSLTYDAYKMIKAPVGDGCGCKKCSCNSEPCGVINGVSYLSEDVELGGETYQRVIKTKLCPNGDLVQEISEPFAQKNSEGEDVVVFRTYSTSVLAQLTLKPCGCVEPTLDNQRKCTDFCGCPVVCCTPQCDPTEITVPANKYGHYKIDMETGLIYLFDSGT
jgi:hypothetical protein